MHPTDGALRRALDEPASLPDTDRDHVATCAHCQHVLSEATADRDCAQSLLTVDDVHRRRRIVRDTASSIERPC